MPLATTRLRAGAAVVAVVLSLAACAHLPPREPLVTQPMSARPAVVPAATAAANGAIYRTGAGSTSWSLFEDRRPRNVGDVLTIVVSESSNASKASAATSSRDGKAGVQLDVIPRVLGGLFNNQNASVSGNNSLDAKGGANASNNFNGVITVTVVDLLANGNLLVSGEKQMLINQGTEYIRFSGVVDPRTVSGGNTVLSTQVADARIEYSAKGFIDEAQTMGWLQRLFLNVLPL
jgi:flagellar L-ring protein precursor FlgH